MNDCEIMKIYIYTNLSKLLLKFLLQIIYNSTSCLTLQMKYKEYSLIFEEFLVLIVVIMNKIAVTVLSSPLVFQKAYQN